MEKVKGEKSFLGQGDQEAYSCKTDSWFELDWTKLKHLFENPMHFLICLSLYFDYMPEISGTDKGLIHEQNDPKLDSPQEEKGITIFLMSIVQRFFHMLFVFIGFNGLIYGRKRWCAFTQKSFVFGYFVLQVASHVVHFEGKMASIAH